MLSKAQHEFYVKVYLLYGEKFVFFNKKTNYDLWEEYYSNVKKISVSNMYSKGYVSVNNCGKLQITFTEKFIEEISNDQ